MENQRSLLLFSESIKSEKTRKNYTDQLRRFLEFTKIRDYDALAKMDKDKLQELVVDYVIHLKKKVNPNSVSTLMTGIKHFFIMNEVGLYWELIQRLYPERIKQSGSKAWTTEQIKRMLESTTSKRNKAIIHFLASTGSRVGVFDYDLSMKNLIDVGDNCKAVLIYAGDKEEYWSFLTPEVTSTLEEYFEERRKDNERFYEDTPIFRTEYVLGIEKAKPLKRAAIISMIFRIINKAGLERKRVNRNFDIQMDHGFRKRFNTIMKLENEVNSNIAEKLMGHKNGLDGTYFKPTIEKCFIEFKKAIKELTISEEQRQKIKIEESQKKLDEYEKSKLKNVELEQKIKDIAAEHQKTKERLDRIDRRESLIREYGKLQKEIEKSIREKNDEWCEIRLEQQKIEKELTDLYD